MALSIVGNWRLRLLSFWRSMGTFPRYKPRWPACSTLGGLRSSVELCPKFPELRQECLLGG